jgi:YHS domain-containing protein
MRWIVFVAILVILIVAMTPSLRARGTRGPRPAASPRDELVKDPVCQTYVVRSRALTAEDHGVTVHFCGRECAERYRRGQGRA